MDGSGFGHKILRGSVRTRSQALGLWVPLLLEASFMGRRVEGMDRGKKTASVSEVGIPGISYYHSFPIHPLPLVPTSSQEFLSRKCLPPFPPSKSPSSGAHACSPSSHP